MKNGIKADKNWILLHFALFFCAGQRGLLEGCTQSALASPRGCIESAATVAILNEHEGDCIRAACTSHSMRLLLRLFTKKKRENL